MLDQPDQADQVVLVTGSNKGLGLALVQELCERLPRAAVYLTARDEALGLAAVARLRDQGFTPRFHQLDVTDAGSVERLRDHLQRTHASLDMLVNNAGIAESLDPHLSYEECARVVVTNYRGALDVLRALGPLLRRGARVLNVSSDCGHLSNVRDQHWTRRLAADDLTLQDVDAFVDWFLCELLTGTWRGEALADGGTFPAYRVAKVALSAATRVLARELAARGVLAVSVHPGLVRTDMTRGVGFLSAGEAARTLTQLLLAPTLTPGGYYWHDGRELEWRDASADYFFKSATLRPTAGHDDKGEEQQ